MTTNDISLAHGVTGLLKSFNDAGIITAADVHVATTLTRLTGEGRPELALLTALTVRAVRQGSVCLDLDLIPDSPDNVLAEDWEIPAGEWPTIDWAEAIAASSLTTVDPAPMTMDGSRVYLSRYRADETFVLEQIRARLPEQVPPTSAEVLASLDVYFADDAYADQRRAAETAAKSAFSIITGGPGSGKTTTVARLIGVLLDSNPDLRIGLTAPTGKAAARMVEAIHQATGQSGFPADHVDKISAMTASTIHRFLSYSPSRGYRHNRENPVPYDVVIVDETSMVSLDLMRRLLDAIPADTRLIFVGDANQLASVEVGAVFADLIEGLDPHPAKPVASLEQSRRFGRGINDLARAVNDGDATEVLTLLHAGSASPQEPVGMVAADELLELLMPTVIDMYEAAGEGDVEASLGLLEAQQLLCAHRDGPYGAGWWNRTIAARLGRELGTRLDGHFPGQPLIVLKNDYTLRLYNGDTGVVINQHGRLVVAFAEGEGIRLVPLSQLADVMPAYAMTVHRSQGSQFGRVYVLLPEEGSRILTRELLYTGLTRAQEKVRVIGSDVALTAAVARRVERASGLVERLTHP